MNTTHIGVDLAEIAQTNLQLLGQMRGNGYTETDLLRVAHAYRFAAGLFANQFRADGKPFVAHLAGTASILAWLQQETDVVIAGLLHAVYQEGDYARALPGMTAAKRGELLRATGARVESLVAAYSRGSRNLAGICASHARFGEMSESDRTVLLMQLANELDDYRDLAAHYAANAIERIDKVRQCGAQQVEMALWLGYPQLAELLRRTFAATLEARLPSGLQSAYANGHAIIPGSCMVAPSNLALRALRKSRRLLTQRRI